MIKKLIVTSILLLYSSSVYAVPWSTVLTSLQVYQSTTPACAGGAYKIVDTGTSSVKSVRVDQVCPDTAPYQDFYVIKSTAQNCQWQDWSGYGWEGGGCYVGGYHCAWSGACTKKTYHCGGAVSDTATTCGGFGVGVKPADQDCAWNTGSAYHTCADVTTVVASYTIEDCAHPAITYMTVHAGANSSSSYSYIGPNCNCTPYGYKFVNSVAHAGGGMVSCNYQIFSTQTNSNVNLQHAGDPDPGTSPWPDQPPTTYTNYGDGHDKMTGASPNGLPTTLDCTDYGHKCTATTQSGDSELVYTWDTDTGTETYTIHASGNPTENTTTWSPDGGTSVEDLDTRTGEKTETTTAPDGTVTTTESSGNETEETVTTPNGLVYTTTKRPGASSVVTFQTGSGTVITTQSSSITSNYTPTGGYKITTTIATNGSNTTTTQSVVTYPGMGTGNAYSLDVGSGHFGTPKGDFSGLLSGFVTQMKTGGAVGAYSINGLIPPNAGDSHYSIVTSKYGTLQLDYSQSQYNTAFSLIKSIMILCSLIASVKIVTINK